MLAYGKAIVGALVAGLSALAAALGDNTVSGQEWVTIALAVVLAFGAVWGVPNRPPSS